MTTRRRSVPASAVAEPDYLRLGDQICFPIYLASRLLVNAYRPLLDPLGITYPQYLVLLVLWEHDRMNVGAIGEKLHLDTGTLTPLLKRMEKQGLIVRSRCGSDDRIVENQLTEAGRALKKAAKDIPVQMLCDAQLELSQALEIKRAVDGLVEKLLQSEGRGVSGIVKRASRSA